MVGFKGVVLWVYFGIYFLGFIAVLVGICGDSKVFVVRFFGKEGKFFYSIVYKGA